MINNLLEAKNGPIGLFENRPSEQLAPSHRRGKKIGGKELEELSINKYEKNGRGITFKDVREKFFCSRKQAQRKLKNACIEKIDKEGKKTSILFRPFERTNPQQFFPYSKRAKIIENWKKNKYRPLDPTGVTYSNTGHSSTYPLHNAIENEMVQSFLFQLSLLPFQPLHMHNIHLWTIIDKSHYEELKLKPAFNKTKISKRKNWSKRSYLQIQ